MRKTVFLLKLYFQRTGLAAGCLPVLLFCALALCPGEAAFAAQSLKAKQRPATLPVVTSQMKKQVPSPVEKKREAKAPLQKTSAPDKSKGNKTVKKNKAGLRGFSSNPFGLEDKYLGLRNAASKTNPLSAEALKAKAVRPAQESLDSRISISGNNPAPSDNRLSPQRAPFTGGPHTLPYMDKNQSPEVSMEYKISPKAATRFVVNPQNPNSPLHRPAEYDKRVNSGGVYMDVEVSENVQLKMGGEYCEIENHRLYGNEKNSQGASVGVEWNF